MLQTSSQVWLEWGIPEELKNVLSHAKEIICPSNRSELTDLALGGPNNKTFEVGYDVKDNGYVQEARVVRCKNGVAVNYIEPYLRRRDPDCMYVNNFDETDKISYQEEFDEPFDSLRETTLDWVKNNDLILIPFLAGGKEYGYPALLIAPKNTGFFALGLYNLQETLDPNDLGPEFKPSAVIYLAPPFRHTHFKGKQVVVHNNNNDIHEIFSYNLYPGPSAKKGVYGVLLSIGEKEGWTTVHGSSVKVITPYDNEIAFLHEGASGSGKSEMLEYAHRGKDGRLKFGKNVLNGGKKYLSLGQSCKLQPLTDDMALCHPKFQKKGGKLVVADAEAGWFIRVNHIQNYGTDPILEDMSIHPQEPLLFLNIEAHPDATCLIWEHTEDKPGVKCPNPRVIIPRNAFKRILHKPTKIDYRSFGLRTPPCSAENPTYGILGLMHLLPPSLAWLWRLVAPRGFANPSIIDEGELSSEGVGSYWPFTIGKRVNHANILLQQIIDTPKTRYTLIPNQHIGVWQVGFMPQWVAREYLARRGQALFDVNKIKPARCQLLGCTIREMQFEGSIIPNTYMEVNTQPEVGNEAYDKGAEILTAFFKKELEQYLQPELMPLGREIIECCLNDGTLQDYESFIPPKY